MKTCPACGSPMEDHEQFCSQCGVKYAEPPQPAPAPAPAPAFCRSCGERLDPETVFCPNCGANVRDVPAPEAPAAPEAFSDLDVSFGEAKKAPKKSKAKLIGIIGGAVGLAAVIAVVVIVLMNTVFSSPAKKFVKYQRELVVEQGVQQLAEAAEKLNASSELSTDVTITADCDNAMLRSILRDSSVTVKVDMKKDSLLLNGELNIMGNQALTGTLTYGDGKVGFCLPEADPTYYVSDIGELAYKLADMRPSQADKLSELKMPNVSTSTLKKLVNAYFDILASAVTGDNVKKSDKNRIRLDELHETLTGDVYIFKPGADEIEDMLLKLAEKLKDDEELRGFVSEMMGGETAGLLMGDQNLDFERALDDELDDLAEELEDSARDIGRSLERAGFTWTLGVVDGKVRLNKIETDGGDDVFAVEISDGKAILYVSSDGEVDASVRITYEQTDELYSGNLVISADGEEVSVRFKDVDLKNTSALGIPCGAFTLVIDGQDMELKVAKSGDGGTDHTLSLSEYYFSGYGYLDGLELTLHTTDKKSTASKPKSKPVDISDYSRSEMEDIFEDIEYDLGNVLAGMGGSLLGGW